MSGKKGRSGRRTANEERSLKDLSKMTYEYLVNNFHKFSENNKIKIALEIQKRVMPSKLEVNAPFTFLDMVKRASLELQERADIEMKEDKEDGSYYYESE